MFVLVFVFVLVVLFFQLDGGVVERKEFGCFILDLCALFCRHMTHSSFLPILSSPTMVRSISVNGMLTFTAMPSSM